MLERLLLLRSQCDALSTDDTRFFIPSAMWDAITEIVQCLLPFQKAALRLQNENITITDAYKTFNICHMETAEIGTVGSTPWVYEIMIHRIRRFLNV